jgi:hypothetical protein
VRISFAIAILLLTVMAGPVARAQTPPQGDPITVLDHVKQLTEQLQFTADQKTQIEALFKKADDDVRSAKEDMQNASEEERRARFGDIFSDLRLQIGQLLSDDQRVELRQKLQTLRNATTAPSNSAESPNPGAQTPAPAPPNAPTRRPGGFGLNNGTGRAGGGGGPQRGVQFLQRLKNNLDQLGLSAGQQTRVDDLLTDVRQQLQTLRQGIQSGSTDRSTAREKVQSILAASRTKLTAILTPDQLDKLRNLMPQAFGQGGGGPGGAGIGNIAAKSPPPPLPTTKPFARAAPAVDQQAPDFSLKTLNGQTVRLSSYNHKLLVLVFGSYSNPPFRDKAAGLEALRDQYGTRGVEFLIVYTRETHPFGGWEVQRNKTDKIEIAQPATDRDRESIAARAKTAMKLSITMALDTMDDKTAAAYSVGDGAPAYLIGRDGKILFHQSWLEPMALGDAIEDGLK